MGVLGKLAWRGFSFSYGLANLFVLVVIAVYRDGALTRNRKMSEEEEQELAIAQQKYWSLAASPFEGFRHDFYTLRNGMKLHYVVNDTDEKVKEKNVLIFMHGFPDSYILWRHLLTSSALESYILIAVDLPGYGGSSSPPSYNPSDMLEAVTGFILGMRELYLAEGGKLIMVTHDWGGIIGARLAAEARELADRWIIAGAVVPQHVRSNATTYLASSRQMFHTYLRRPFHFTLLRKSFTTLSPVLGQIGRSFYVFVLNLPWPIATFFVRFGNYWFLRLLHKVQADLLRNGGFTRDLSEREKADWLAASSGPGKMQCSTSDGDGDGAKLVYPESVRKRMADHGMSAKIRIYREGLLFGTWEKSIGTVVALSETPVDPSRAGSGAGLFEDGPHGAPKVPATVIWGKYDTAFEPRLVIEGMSDYLTKGSQVVVLEKSGHWLPCESKGVKVLETVARWAAEGEMTPLSQRLKGLEDLKVLVDKK